MKIWIVAAVVLLLAIFGTAVWMRRSARALVHARRLRIDRFKLRRKHAEIQLDVFSDRNVVAEIRNYAKTHKVSVDTATHQAHTYLREIVPKFNLLAYYRFGAPVARAILYFLYRVAVDRSVLEAFNRTATKDTVVVYVINHRSNVDYVLVAHMLFRFVSLSYAVGEWARVWPLNHLFKWFGGYFVRRRYREPLYHAVLRAFVQTITRNGVTQGIFLEGGLSRDGAFLPPKIGMLDYIITSKQSPEFVAPLVIIPTSINYDRTLEDRALTEELLGREDRSGRLAKLGTTFEFLFKNVFRSIRGRFKRYGYAAVAFGEPIVIDEVVRREPSLLAATFDERKPAMKRLADEIMSRISEALPATPIPMVAKVLGEADRPMRDGEIEAGIAEVLSRHQASATLLREKTAGEIWERARKLLALRHLVEETPAGWQWNPSENLLRDYYANSLLPYRRDE